MRGQGGCGWSIEAEEAERARGARIRVSHAGPAFFAGAGTQDRGRGPGDVHRRRGPEDVPGDAVVRDSTHYLEELQLRLAGMICGYGGIRGGAQREIVLGGFEPKGKEGSGSLKGVFPLYLVSNRSH